MAIARVERKSLAWARIFHVYGPESPPEKVPGFFIDRLLNQQRVRCETPHRILDFLHISDLSRALCMLLKSDFQGPINLASGDGVSLGEIAKLIAKQLSADSLLEINESSTVSDRLVADIGPLRDNIAFRPSLSLDEGLRLTIEWHRGQNVLKSLR